VHVECSVSPCKPLLTCNAIPEHLAGRQILSLKDWEASTDALNSTLEANTSSVYGYSHGVDY
jgi:hypothetical protein